MARLFFSGIAGAGMRPLALLMRAWGHEVSGSDRGFDQGKQEELRQQLLAKGIAIVPQDGSGIVPGIDRVVFSTAVESQTPEIIAARARGIPLQPRPALLAEVVNAAVPGVAIAGTSGKSTITGMLQWILRAHGLRATVLGGAPLAGEAPTALTAGAPGDPVVAEACESDGTLPLYRPAIGVLQSIARDHGEVEQVRAQFAAFARQCTTLIANVDAADVAAIAREHPQALTVGQRGEACRLSVIEAGPDEGRARLSWPDGAIDVSLPQPGLHNLANAAAAACVAHRLGVPLPAIREALATFPGVARRFEIVGRTGDGIRVVDDYAHNAEKIAAAIRAAQLGCERLVAIFQPHGFGPARFLRPELAQLLPALLRPHDRFCYAEIYYAGGTITRDLSSRDLAADLPAALACAYAASHAEVLRWAATEARPGDTVLLMGARDPELPRLARALAGLL